MKQKIFIGKLKRYKKWTILYLSNHILFWYYYLKNRNEPIENKTKGIIWIDFRSNVFRRRIASITIWFIKAGYDVYLKDSFRFIGSIDRMSFRKVLFKYSKCKISLNKPNNVKWILTNKFKTTFEKNEICVDNNYWQPELENTLHIPLGMHPYFYYFNLIPPNLISIRQKGNRKIGIFFSGNLDVDFYDWKIIEKKFQLLSRNKIIDHLKLKMNPENIVELKQIKNIKNSDLANKFLFNDSRKVIIEMHDFIKFLSNCSFFLFTPGVSHPLCHNNTESIAAGCIPITQYAHYFYPKLEHGKTCLEFSNEDDLVEQVNLALSMDEIEISKMRKNVIQYYDQYLSEEAIVGNIEQKVFNDGADKLILL